MGIRQPVEPILTVELLTEILQALLNLLDSLSDEDWQRPTVCAGWSVRDVALHMLGDDVGLLSNMRDQDGQYHAFEGWDGLVAFINAQNALWVEAARRMSRRLLIDLLQFTGTQVITSFESIDPLRMGGPVGWAGDHPDPMWLHMARDLTEYWTHTQHIADAVGQEILRDARYLGPVLTTFAHALPHTFRAVDAPVDTLVRFQITGSWEGEWHLVREEAGWALYARTDLSPACTVTMDGDTAWRLFTRNQPVTLLRPGIQITGDTRLGEVTLQTVAIIA